MTTTRKRAFTLIELLVCIAIITAIIAIIIPGLSHSRESARRTVCASNLRQFAGAVNAYTVSRGDLPRATNVALLADYTGTMGTLLGGDLPAAIWHCPSDRERATYSHPFAWDHSRRRLAKYDANPRWYIASDTEFRHGGKRQLSWLDGHVEWTDEDIAPEVQIIP